MSGYEWGAYASPTSCTPKLALGATSLAAYLQDSFAYTFSMGICNCRNTRGGSSFSHHANCRAYDCGIPTNGGVYRPELGDPIHQLLGPNGRRLGLDHLILNRIIYSARSPNGREYKGTHPHYNHAHIGLTAAAGGNLNYASIVAILGPPVGVPIGDEFMQAGDKGFQVAVAQKRLDALGYDLGLFTPFTGPIPAWWTEGAFAKGQDGDFGGVMTTAVSDFQADLGEAVTGVLNGVAAATLGMSGSTQGEKGDKGDQGDKGLKGIQGNPGDKGDKGDKGATGSRGAQGAKGDRGAPGTPGANGADGEDGADGKTGATGAKGVKGDVGADGPDGPQGEAGVGLEPGQEIEFGTTGKVL